MRMFERSTWGANVLLEVTDLHAGYSAGVVLSGLNLAIESQCIVAVVGRNGVGKTTFIKTLMGLIAPRRGSIVFDGRNVAGMSPAARARIGMAYVPQGRRIFPKLTALENLLVGVKAANLPPRAIEPVLEQFPRLIPKLNNLGASLSGGEQQLLALARALVLQPRVLLLDEPSEGIQPSMLDEIQQVLLQAQQRQKLSVLLVEQNLEFAAELANTVHVMDSGRISRQVEPAVLLGSTLIPEFLGVTEV